MSDTPVKPRANSDEMAREIKTLQAQLAEARGHPVRTIRDYALHLAARVLARWSPPLPSSIGTKMTSVARNRHPARSVAAWDQHALDNLATRPMGKLLERPGGVPHDPSRPTVLLVTHDMLRGGAPILALNIAQEFSRHFNVVVVAVQPGALVDDFRSVATAVYEPPKWLPKVPDYSAEIAAMQARHGFLFAVLNSIVSSPVVRPLVAEGVPMIGLVHEFILYLPDQDQHRDVIQMADLLVFSTLLTRDDAALRLGPMDMSKVRILPQGKCRTSGHTVDPDAHRTAGDNLRARLRPPGTEGAHLILGVGSVEYRKGVDIFLACAVKARARMPDAALRFVWIGGGYDPKSDLGYSAYLADEITRAGLQDLVEILPPTTAIEVAFQEADVFLMTSRLDPQPNVTIDCLFFGLPMLCFEKATGATELLSKIGLTEDCVAPYLDTDVMVEKLERLLADPARCKTIAEKGKALANSDLQIEQYADQLRQMSLDVVEATKARRAVKG